MCSLGIVGVVDSCFADTKVLATNVYGIELLNKDYSEEDLSWGSKDKTLQCETCEKQ